ncbi:hypothetical protein H072_8268 [Dactylellina haptotyla CBS 200.50]|uniref:Extracellular membrane protein CFEM domain-containing protein n=1 Tax=Dactylellina haptotyla (strain CBS 200.50) TaxID=1284197 RepID=S8BFE6_DACHA|nr:hypothetical protein H072_8268 [Dactylellina haptotyla CBS 200.50]
MRRRPLLRKTLVAAAAVLVLPPSLALVLLDATITQAPHPTFVHDRLHPRQTASSSAPHGREACSALYSVYSWCSTSGYGNLAGPSALASCACYYSETWVPRIFDDIATSCYDYVRSVQPGALSAIGEYLNVCFLAGDVSKSFTQGSLACNTLASIITSCARRSETRTGSSSLVFSGSSSLANCACYTSSSKYAPDRFDHLASDCYTYAQNLAGQGGGISTLVGFCGNLGDVQQSASTALQKCELFENQYDACESAYTRDFGKLASSLQASCLCYGARTMWVPGAIDGAVQTCVGYLKTADPQRARTIEAFGGGFCQGLGDLRHPSSTSATPGSTTSVVKPTTTATKGSSSSLTESSIPSSSGSPSSSASIPSRTTALPSTTAPAIVGTAENSHSKLVSSDLLSCFMFLFSLLPLLL